jgi:hypothetical protein
MAIIQTRSLEEFLDKASIDSGTKSVGGKITVQSAIVERHPDGSQRYMIQWTYQGNGSADKILFSVDPTFNPKDPEPPTYNDYVSSEISGAVNGLRQRALEAAASTKRPHMDYEIIVARRKFYAEQIADILHAPDLPIAGFDVSVFKYGRGVSEGAQVGPQFDTSDIYKNGKRNGMTDEDVLKRVKERLGSR